jgi:hypothetical protein
MTRFSQYKHTIIWAGVALFFMLFAAIYNHFGHGVFSALMTFNYVPSVVLFLLYALTESTRSRLLVSRSWWFVNLGVLLITIGLILGGVFKIAGTGSPYVVGYYALGGVSVFFGLLKGHPYISNANNAPENRKIKL